MIVCLAANPSVDRLLEVGAVEVGGIHRPYRVTAVAGGKGLNVARAAVTLGGRVRAVALLGGHAGRWIAEQLAEAGVETACAWRAGETRTCVSVFGAADGRLTEFYEPGPAVAADEWQAFEALAAEAVAPGSVVTLSGSLPPGAPADGWARLARSAAAAGGRVLLDSHGEPLGLALREAPMLVKVNAPEAAAATGMPVFDAGSAVLAARALVKQGARAAIVTLGAEGCVVLEREEVYACASGPRGPYPVGSGDSFLAGVGAGLNRGLSLAEAARLGAAAASANAALPGPGVLDRATAEAHLQRISVQHLTAQD